jgi:hypothetical protein
MVPSFRSICMLRTTLAEKQKANFLYVERSSTERDRDRIYREQQDGDTGATKTASISMSIPIFAAFSDTVPAGRAKGEL